LDQLWHSLAQGGHPLVLISGWLVLFLRTIGYGWRMACCAGCGTSDNLIYFSARRGQPVCQLCGAPWHSRLWRLTDPLRCMMAEIDCMEVDQITKNRLPTIAEWWQLYQIGMASLAYHGGVVLLGDSSFRQVAGVWSKVDD
ncbi:MAG: DNA repair protein RecO C-terminal domain-containing protein, partial [Magnetococcales bacterium]|nr:DNA repair protein RecO C-terminal domain-containing protein [Magnetococcales bacterium]